MRELTSAWAALAGAAVGLSALAGCDASPIARLQVGVSTEADMRRALGEPAAVYDAPEGAREFEYPRQPEGHENWFVTVGADGLVREIRQALAPATFARVVPGLDKAEVRRLLGRPARTTFYDLKREEVWDWRHGDAATPLFFSVTFDADGRVVASGSGPDPRREHVGL
ncbi:outer membrane protein assembly factor BamE [Azohydromonas sediminis]|uniref:outer membrane protein assembly factor BamE n=1 Tax=Azohydromonas sediminis TaxID=2259674 RepID=UPI000E646763|nr:outer membrane protein assembly factor BamE [Azohydromonas sediminis]